jgi:hypothetical protein
MTLPFLEKECGDRLFFVQIRRSAMTLLFLEKERGDRLFVLLAEAR